MKLEDEKKLVAEKLMGKEVFLKSHREDRMNRNPNKFDYCTTMGFLANWNPQSDLICWPEIWEYVWDKSTEFRRQFIFNLRELCWDDELYLQFDHEFELITAKSKILWEALIKTLESVPREA